MPKRMKDQYGLPVNEPTDHTDTNGFGYDANLLDLAKEPAPVAPTPRTIHKYELAITDDPTIIDAPIIEILHADQQNGKLYVWVVVDDGPDEEFEFYVVGTGNPMPEGAVDHVATVMTYEGFVWHVFTNAFWSDDTRWDR